MQEEQQTNHLFQDSSLITFDQDHSNIESDPFLLERPKSSPKISKFRKLKCISFFILKTLKNSIFFFLNLINFLKS